MFEFQNDLFMNALSGRDFDETCALVCYATNAAHDELAELARIVATSDTPTQDRDSFLRSSSSIQLLEDAPALEFDLESELSKAFEHVEPPLAAPTRMPFDASALLEEVAASPAPEVSPVLDFSPLPATETIAQDVMANVDEDGLPHDFADMIGAELEKALADEVAADPTFAASVDEYQFTDIQPHFEAVVDPAPSNAETVAMQGSMPDDFAAGAVAEPNFEDELSRLMGDAPLPSASDAQVDVAQPVPSQMLDPWDMPEIVTAPVVPQVEEFAAKPAEHTEFTPPQMQDYSDPAQDYSDPAADLNAFLDEQAAISKANSAGGFIAAQPALAEPVEPAEAASDNATVSMPNVAEPYFYTPEPSDVFEPSVPGSDDDPIVIPDAHAIAALSTKQNSGRKAAIAVVGLALIGGMMAVGYSSVASNGGDTPTILASSEPIKVKPDDAGGKIVPNQDQSVYRSVDGGTQEQPRQETLTDNTEAPIVVSQNKQDQRLTESQSGSSEGLVLKPRRVRTVVVRPDGSIVSSGAQGFNNSPAIEVPTLSLRPEVGTFGTQQTAAQAGNSENASASNGVDATNPEAGATASEPVSVKPVAVKPVEAKPVKVAKVEPAVAKKPAKTTPKEVSAETTASVPKVDSPYAVQVSSQRSVEAAQKSYQNLSRRYASILGGKGVDIRKGVVKGKGTYFRVRIPAQTKAAANKICGQLKAAGGACFVTR